MLENAVQVCWSWGILGFIYPIKGVRMVDMAIILAVLLLMLFELVIVQ